MKFMRRLFRTAFEINRFSSLYFPLAAFQVPTEKHSHALASERENDDKNQAKKSFHTRPGNKTRLSTLNFKRFREHHRNLLLEKN